MSRFVLSLVIGAGALLYQGPCCAESRDMTPQKLSLRKLGEAAEVAFSYAMDSHKIEKELEIEPRSLGLSETQQMLLDQIEVSRDSIFMTLRF